MALVDRLASFASGAVVLLLSLPASDMVPIAQWNLHTWGRLQERRRDAPDTGQDRLNRELTPFLPAAGPIGFLNVSGGDATRAQFFLQYSLAPRTLVASTDQEFVIEFGVPAGTVGLSGDARFGLVKSFAVDLRVFRRVSR